MWLSWRKENRIDADFATVVGRRIDPTINFGEITPAIRIEFALRFYIRVCSLSKRLWVPDALRLGMPQSRWGTDGLRGQRWPELSKQGYL